MDNTNVIQQGGFFGFSFNWVGRMLLAAFFVYLGVRSIMNFSAFTASLTALNMPYPALIAVILIILSLIGGLLFTGIFAVYNSVTIGKLFLIIYSLFMLVTQYRVSNGNDTENMLKNLAVLGGVLAS
jgi:uncharacterized membrane protein YphA (DoxX/SURF4 family)